MKYAPYELVAVAITATKTPLSIGELLPDLFGKDHFLLLSNLGLLVGFLIVTLGVVMLLHNSPSFFVLPGVLLALLPIGFATFCFLSG